jgi:hypothetical protein
LFGYINKPMYAYNVGIHINFTRYKSKNTNTNTFWNRHVERISSKSPLPRYHLHENKIENKEEQKKKKDHLSSNSFAVLVSLKASPAIMPWI